MTATAVVIRPAPATGSRTSTGSGASTSPGTTVLIAAIIAAIATLLVAVLTQALTGRRERTARRYERVRAGLETAQDACSTLRTALRAYGIQLRRDQGAFTAEVIDTQQRFDVALQKAQVAIKRIDPLAADAVSDWIQVAQVRFISPADVSAAIEEQRWEAVVAIVGAALTDPEAVVRPLDVVVEAERKAREERRSKAGPESP